MLLHPDAYSQCIFCNNKKAHKLVGFFLDDGKKKSFQPWPYIGYGLHYITNGAFP
jgi:hypothetical protein